MEVKVTKKIWWLNPATIFLLIMSGIFLGVISVSENNFSKYYNVNKYIDQATIWYAILGCISFVVGIVFTLLLLGKLESTQTFYKEIKRGHKFYRRTITVLFLFTTFGYLMWAFMLFKNGASISLFRGVLLGEENAIYTLKHNYLTKVAGVTSFTNFGIPFIIVATYYNFYNKQKTVFKMMVIVYLMTVLRGIFFAERLAILEILIPTVIIYFFLRVKEGRPPKFFRYYPLIGFSFVFSLFAIGEYFRSWSNYYQYISESYSDFITTRFFGYYLTAINTGTLYIEELNTLPFPYFTFEWFWKFPIIGGDSYTNLFHTSPPEIVLDKLYTRGNPEFNNPSGLLLPFLDYGVFGAITFWLFFGAITGFLYVFFKKGYLLGMLLYPAWFIGITEIPRYLYFVSGRFFPACVTLVFITLLVVFLRKKSHVKVSAKRGNEETLINSH